MCPSYFFSALAIGIYTIYFHGRNIFYQYAYVTKLSKENTQHPQESEFPHFWEFLRTDLEDIRNDDNKVKKFFSWLAENKFSNSRKRLSDIFKILVSGFIVFMIFWVASNHYYQAIASSKTFGFSVPNGLERAPVVHRRAWRRRDGVGLDVRR